MSAARVHHGFLAMLRDALPDEHGERVTLPLVCRLIQRARRAMPAVSPELDPLDQLAEIRERVIRLAKEEMTDATR
jgi:hypothetical protein